MVWVECGEMGNSSWIDLDTGNQIIITGRESWAVMMLLPNDRTIALRKNISRGDAEQYVKTITKHTR